MQVTGPHRRVQKQHCFGSEGTTAHVRIRSPRKSVPHRNICLAVTVISQLKYINDVCKII